MCTAYICTNVRISVRMCVYATCECIDLTSLTGISLPGMNSSLHVRLCSRSIASLVMRNVAGNLFPSGFSHLQLNTFPHSISDIYVCMMLLEPISKTYSHITLPSRHLPHRRPMSLHSRNWQLSDLNSKRHVSSLIVSLLYETHSPTRLHSLCCMVPNVSVCLLSAESLLSRTLVARSPLISG